MYSISKAALKEEVEKLAEKAFHQRLISGYGDGEFPNKYQIVYEGKPRHFSLEHARIFLEELMQW
ncbi:MAG: hypothetical protein HC769_17515 [Cyanobacteria bacterium CRU_2_1]|nr:hypothetical protein [Cyanobacteria bacterium RU_5_0]NJR60467.1 hypothetical protein [Cyanobacteria bacterium CRU_2_1]